MKLRDLQELILSKKKEAKALLLKNDIKGCKALKKEIENLTEKMNNLQSVEDEERGRFMAEKKQTNKVYDTFFENLKNSYRGIFTNAMKESVDSDGGFIVPRDISTKIETLLREKYSLKELVSSENVKTFEGARTFEVNSKHVPFDKVEEEAVFGDVAIPKFTRINYKLSKFGGILKTSKELLEDSSENVMSYLMNWLTDKMVATYNGLILAEADRVLTGTTGIKSYDDIKTILNTKIDPALKNDCVILTNQTGYNWLDTLKDKNDNYILKPLITDPSVQSVEGKFRIVVLSDDTLAVKAKKVPFYIGNFKEFIRVFERGVYSMEASEVAGELWNKDLVGIKTRFRCDVKVVDDKAVVKGELTQA